MRRYGGLWDRLVAWDNLVLAARKAQRGKLRREAVRAFQFDREKELVRIQAELLNGSYRPGPFRVHRITRPKARLISAAPYRDRVVHHALMNVLEPILEVHFHPDSYACRRGRGTHAAANRLQRLMRGHRYALACDVRRFFPSIDHEILKGTFRRLIKDPRALWLMDLIVDSSNDQGGPPSWFAGDDLLTPLERRRGLPIGNLTSQWFANWMLSTLDHRVTGGLGIGAYVRYCDDFVLLDNDRMRLRAALEGIRECLAGLRLEMHPGAFVRPVRSGLRFVGYRIWASHRLLRKDNVRAFRRRVRRMQAAYAAGAVDWDHIRPRLASWIGHARQADTRRLLRRLSREWRFSRGGAESACDPRRVVEQQRGERRVHEPQQQHAGQSEQQHRVPSGPALSGVREHQARNPAAYGPPERGFESPGPVPVPCDPPGADSPGRIHAVGPGGAGRFAEGPIRSRFSEPTRGAR